MWYIYKNFDIEKEVALALSTEWEEIKNYDRLFFHFFAACKRKFAQNQHHIDTVKQTEGFPSVCHFYAVVLSV